MNSQDYLKAAFQTAKEGQPRLTISSYAGKLGLSSSTLKMILTGKRRLTVHQALKVAKSLRLPDEETSLLETLALRDSAQEPWERAHYTRRLSQQEKVRKVRTIHASDRELLTDPMSLPLLIYLMETGAGGIAPLDCQNVGQLFGLEASRVKDAVVRFQRLGLLKVSHDGKFHVLFDRLNHKLLQKRYMKRLLAEASRRVDTDYENRASAFVNYTLATDADSLARLREDLQNMMEKYLAVSPVPGVPRQIAQACFQLFTVARF